MDKKSYFYISVVIVLWASSAAVSKILLMDISNLQLLFLTSFYATIFLFIVVILQNKVYLVKILKIRDYLTFMFLGFIGVFLYTFFLFEALKYLRAQEAFILNYLWPIMVVIFSTIILKEKFRLINILGILISFLGVSFIITQANLGLSFSSLKGTAFAIGCAVSYGLFSVLSKKNDYDVYLSTMFYYFFSFIFSSILFLMQPLNQISSFQLIGVLWFGIFPNGVAYVLWILALKHGDTAEISNYIFLTPFISLIYIHFLLGEKIFINSVIGLILIVIGILIQSTRK